MKIPKCIETVMKIRAEVIAQHPELMKIFGGACPEKEAIVAQYVLAATMLDISNSVDEASISNRG